MSRSSYLPQCSRQQLQGKHAKDQSAQCRPFFIYFIYFLSPNRWDASFLHSELLSAKTEAGEPKSDFLLKRGNPIRAALIQRPQRWNQKKMESIVRRQGGGPQARVTWSSGWAAVTSAHDLLFHVGVWKLELTWGQSHICCNSGLLLNSFFY